MRNACDSREVVRLWWRSRIGGLSGVGRIAREGRFENHTTALSRGRRDAQQWQNNFECVGNIICGSTTYRRRGQIDSGRLDMLRSAKEERVW